MSFAAKPVSLGTSDTNIVSCPATQSGSVHGLVFSNVTGSPQTITLKLSNYQDGTTTVISSARVVPANGEFAWPKPINMQQGDAIVAFCSAPNAVVAVYSIYLNSVAPVAKGFAGRGPYSPSASYAINDIVTYGGSAYLAISSSIGSAPPSANWMVLVTNNSSLSTSDIATALGFTPYNAAANPLGFIGNVNPTLLGAYINGLLRVKTMLEIKTAITAATATTSLDLTASDVFKVTIAANTTFAFTNPPAGSDMKSFCVITQNDGTAGRAVSWPVGVKWAGGILPPRTTAANAIDVWSFYTEDGGSTYVGSLSIADAK